MEGLVEKDGKIYNKEGEVAVIISPGFGTGWSTWNFEYSQDCLFDPDCVRLTLVGKRSELKVLAAFKWENGYWHGAFDCIVRWIPAGTVFKVREYDGSESLEFQDSPNWFVA